MCADLALVRTVVAAARTRLEGVSTEPADLILEPFWVEHATPTVEKNEAARHSDGPQCMVGGVRRRACGAEQRLLPVCDRGGVRGWLAPA
jgi:hypothetical protein